MKKTLTVRRLTLKRLTKGNTIFYSMPAPPGPCFTIETLSYAQEVRVGISRQTQFKISQLEKVRLVYLDGNVHNMTSVSYEIGKADNPIRLTVTDDRIEFSTTADEKDNFICWISIDYATHE